MSTVREVAANVLHKVESGQAFANLLLQHALRDEGLSERDKALCTELVYGVLQRRRTLDGLLSGHSRTPLSELNPFVLTILRMTVYQLTFLERIPSYAALNEAVSLCKRKQPRAAGFVNGVLRAFLRDGTSAAERLDKLVSRGKSTVERLGLQFSYPDWMVEHMLKAYGEDRARAILQAQNERAKTSLRVNVRKTTRVDALQALREAVDEAASESLLSEQGIRLGKGFDIGTLPLYRNGLVSVQDEAAMLVAPLLNVHRTERVLDMCAAPGGKTTHIAELQGDAGWVDAYDIHAHKLKLIRQAATRLGVESIHTHMMDARLLGMDVAKQGSYDAVLLDAPCSGIGVLRHRPDIRWRRDEADIRALTALQQQLLRSAVSLCKPGGVVVYSTCTLLPAENGEVVQSVLDDPELTVVNEDITPDLPETVRALTSEDSLGVTIFPDWFETDGFYMARLRKAKKG